MSDKKDKKNRPFLLSIRGVLRRVLTVAIVSSIVFRWADFNAYSFFIGAGVLFLGVALHFYTKGNLTRNKIITTYGPYRFVRHPFYLANLVIDTGMCVMSNNPFVFLGYFIAFLAGYSATMKSEENHLVELHGQDYLDYVKNVPPRIFPVTFPAKPTGEGSFSFPKILREHELARSIRILVYPLLFYPVFSITSYFYAGRYWAAFEENLCLNCLLLSLFGGLHFIARLHDILATKLEEVDFSDHALWLKLARWIFLPLFAVGIFLMPRPLVPADYAWFYAGGAVIALGALLRVIGEVAVKKPDKYAWTWAVFRPDFLGDVLAVAGIAIAGYAYWLAPLLCGMLATSNGFLGVLQARDGVSRPLGALRIPGVILAYAAAAALMAYKTGLISF